VDCNGVQAKPAKEVRLGDTLQVKTESGDFEVSILGISDVRGRAAVAQTLYTETETSKEARRNAAEERKTMPQFEWAYDNRPSKRERRVLNRLRERG
jgi:ribosome-associated heat shock protein Hsp15